MGSCLSKKKGSSSTSSPFAGTKQASTTPVQYPAGLKNSGSVVTCSKPEVGTEPEGNPKKDEKKTVQDKQDSVQEDEGQVKKEIIILTHRKSHDGRDKNSKNPPATAQHNVPQPQSAELMGNINKIVAAEANMDVGVRTSSCTKEEVDAILIRCGRLSRTSSGQAASSTAAAASEKRGRRRYSGSRKSYDFDHCEKDNTRTDEEQKKTNASDKKDLCEDDGMAAAEKRTPSRRRRTRSRERDSSSRERRVSRSPGRRRSSDITTTTANATIANATSNNNSRRGKMVSVPATVSSLVMDKSNNNGGGGRESAATTGIKRTTVKRNAGDGSSRGAASPRSQSPARSNRNATNANKILSDNQQQPSSRKAEQSPCRRNPLSEINPNSLAYPQSTIATNSSSGVQNRPKMELLTEASQKPNVDVNENGKNRTSSRVALEKVVVGANCKSKEQQEAVEVKAQSSVSDNNTVVKTMVQSGVDNLKPQTSSRRSGNLDLNSEALLVPAPQSYTSLLLEDIENFHQKNNTASFSLPACVTKACSILEAVADLNSTTTSNFSGALTSQSSIKDPFVESEVVVNDDVMEPSLHKYVTVLNKVGSLDRVDMEDRESSGSNSFIVSRGKQHCGISSSWEPSSGDSTDCWTSRLKSPREESQNRKSTLGFEGSVSCEAGRDMDGARNKLNSKRKEIDHQNGNGIERAVELDGATKEDFMRYLLSQ